MIYYQLSILKEIIELISPINDAEEIKQIIFKKFEELINDRRMEN